MDPQQPKALLSMTNAELQSEMSVLSMLIQDYDEIEEISSAEGPSEYIQKRNLQTRKKLAEAHGEFYARNGKFLN